MPHKHKTHEETISDIVSGNDVVLFMKGTKERPMCGFSGTVLRILNAFNLNIKDVNILSDVEFKESVKKYTDWPTFPQLYINNKFVGGCDIIVDMYKSGELESLLKEEKLA